MRDGVPVMKLTYTAGAAAGVVINDTPDGYNSTKAYRATMTLRGA